MNGGFSFCGTNISAFGLEYVPETKGMYVFSKTKTQANQEVFEGHDGGYFYGVTYQPKDFALRCIFQNKEITKGTIAQIDSFFRRGKTGRLVFDNMKWLWYAATVIDVDVSQLTNRRNGFVTITLRAYYPFARHDKLFLSYENAFETYILENTGILMEKETPITSFSNVTMSTNYLLYNPGNERASVAIYLAGDAGEGITITNHTTNQACRFIAFNQAGTTDVGKNIVCDSMNGKVVLTDGVTTTHAFLYHDYGYIDLEPAYPILRDVEITATSGSNIVKLTYDIVTEHMIGKYIYIDESWNKIEGVTTKNELVLEEVSLTSDTYFTNIVTMNEISVELGAGAKLTTLDFVYKPTFS